MQLGGWRYGIWASTSGMDMCVPKLIRQLRLRPVQDQRRANYSDLTSLLTYLNKKEAPDPVQWTELCQQPVLYLSRKLSKRETRYSTIGKRVFGHWVGHPHPPVLPLGLGIHSLFGTRAPPVAPPHEGYQRTDYLLVSDFTAF